MKKKDLNYIKKLLRDRLSITTFLTYCDKISEEGRESMKEESKTIERIMNEIEGLKK